MTYPSAKLYARDQANLKELREQQVSAQPTSTRQVDEPSDARTGAHGCRDRGATAIGWAITMPVFLVLVMTIIQAGFFFHARDVALSAAQVGVAQARTVTGGDGAGKAAAFANSVGGNTLTGVRASTTLTRSTVTVTVTGQPLSLVPGVRLPAITASANAPRERFTTPERP